MSTKIKLISIISITLMMVFIVHITVIAATYQLFGQVRDESGNPMAEATVKVIDPSAGFTITSTVTQANGNYSVYVEEGTYSVQVNPPEGSGFRTALAQNLNVTMDKNLDFILVPIGKVSLSGKLLDKDGDGIPGQTVMVERMDGSAGGGSVYTDSQGNYLLHITPGEYKISIFSMYNNRPPNIPSNYTVWSENHMIMEDTILDIQFPQVATITVHVQDPGGNPVANARLYSSRQWTYDLILAGLPAYGYSFASEFVTDENGDVVTWLFPGTHGLVVYAPEGSDLIDVSQYELIMSDQTITIILGYPVTLSGKLLDKDGDGIPGQTVMVERMDGSAGGGSVYTDSQGNYLLHITPGEYKISIFSMYNNRPPNIPSNYTVWSENHMIMEDTILDIQFPQVATITVHVQDPVGNPVANARLYSSRQWNYGLILAGLPAYGYSFASEFVTDENGDVVTWLFPGTHSFLINPPEGSPFSYFTISDIQLMSDKTMVIFLQFSHDTPLTIPILAPEAYQDGSYPDPVSVELSATASPGYSISNTYYVIDNGLQQTYTSPFIISGSGEHILKYWSIDNVGVQELPKVMTFSIQQDSTPPVISYYLTPSSPDGENGWYKSDVTLVWSVSDPESDITRTGCIDQNIIADQLETSYTCSASSAGGSSGPVSVTIKRDTTAPTIEIITPVDGLAYSLNEQVLSQFTCTDELSSIADCAGTNLNGTYIDTGLPVGSKSFVVNASDMAGNSNSLTAIYNIQFATTVFYGPIDNPPMINYANAGRTIPVKWRLTDNNGIPISDPLSFMSITSTTSGYCGGNGDYIEEYSNSSGLKYLGDGNWQFNWKIPNNYAGQCRTMMLNLRDGTTYIAYFEIK